MGCILILHNIRSVLNVGAIFRTADACLAGRRAVGVEKIYLTGYTPGPLDRFGRKRSDFRKSALGAEDTVPWQQAEDVQKAINELRIRNYELIALEQDKRAVDYKSYKPKNKFGLVVGNETEGLPKEILDQCNKIIEIPMKGGKESLNVSVALGVVLFRILDI